MAVSFPGCPQEHSPAACLQIIYWPIEKVRIYAKVKLSESQKQTIDHYLPSITNAEWQTIFQNLRSGVCQSIHHTYNSNLYSCENMSSRYDGETCYYWYTRFINGILKTIRAGGTDYCFKVDHILDLLQFEPDLSAVWLPNEDCFCVSLCISK